MPRIKRWFPVSHDINRDQELWDLEAEHGPKVLRVWLELLSIADRNEGEIPGDIETISKQVAWQVRLKSAKCRTIIGAISDRQWLDIRQTIRIANYWKYHRTPEHNPIPSEPDRSDPNQTEEIKNPDPVKPEPSADFKIEESRRLDPAIKNAADAIYGLDRKKFSRLIVWIKEAQKHRFGTQVIVAALERFFPYATEVRDWYPYLDKLVLKCDQDINRDYHETEHRRHKEEVREASKVLELRRLMKDA